MFVKNDESFICKKCLKHVDKLKYSSRDHCNFCLYSLHVDVTPGDRLNECKGLLRPINVINNKKGRQIEYKCEKCGKIVRNIVAKDDSEEELLNVVKRYTLTGGV